MLLHSAIYCGVPAANSAFRTAQEVFRTLDEKDTEKGTAEDTDKDGAEDGAADHG